MSENFKVNTIIQALRTDFGDTSLLEEHLPGDPFLLFETWLKTALSTDAQGNAMTLCTVGKTGQPDSRMVLLRNVSYGGLTFYSNYNSQKGKDLSHHPAACLHFFWRDQFRQVKIQGEVHKLPEAESDAYFASRPFENQVGAWASQQSEVIASRRELDQRFEQQMALYKDLPVPRPHHWGGYVLVPALFEFWQGRSGRMHDRIKYQHQLNDNNWTIQRLMP